MASEPPFQIKIYVSDITIDNHNLVSHIVDELEEKKFKIDNLELSATIDDIDPGYYIVLDIDIPRIAERKADAATLLPQLKTKIETFFTDLLVSVEDKNSLPRFVISFYWEDFELNDVPVQLSVSDPITASPDFEGVELVIDESNREDVPPPGTPPGQGTSTAAPPTVPPALRRPQAGDIWVNQFDDTLHTYIQSIVEDDGETLVRSIDILNINTLWLDGWHRSNTLTQFYNEAWKYHSKGPRVEAWATNAPTVIFSSREAPTTGTVESVRIYNRYIEIKLQGNNTWYRAHEFLFLDQDERPAQQEPNRARRNLAAALENTIAKRGVEYTLEEFREKIYENDIVILRRWTYDEENKEWIMDEMDCDPATQGQTGSLSMPVKIKVRENGQLKWETTGNKLVLYCARFLKRWVENHTQSPNGNFREIVAVQYLTRDEVLTIQLQEERVSKNTRGQKRRRKELDERQKQSEKRQNDANYTRSASTLAAAGGETFAQRINNMRKKQLLRAEKELLTADHELDTMNLQRKNNIPEQAMPTELEQFDIIGRQKSAENARNELLTVLRSKDKEWVQKEWRGSPPSQRADLWVQWTQSQLETLEEELDFITNKDKLEETADTISAEITKINTILDDNENPLEQSARDELEDKRESLQHRYNYLQWVHRSPELEKGRLAHQMKELKTMLSIQEKLKKRALAVKPEAAGAGMQSTSTGETKPFTLRIVVDDNLSLEATSLIFAMIEDTTVVQSEYKVEIAGYAEYMVREIVLRFHLPSVRDRVGVFQRYIDSIADRFLGEFDKYFERRKELKLTQLWEDIYVEGKLKKKVTLGCCKPNQEEESAGAGGSATSTALTEMLRIGQLKF